MQFPILSVSRRLLALLALWVSALPSLAQEDFSLDNAWARIISHFDGTKTKSWKDTQHNRVLEEKYDKDHVLVQKRIFGYDAKNRLRNGIIMDAKGKALGSTRYGYDSYDRICEEQLSNAKGQLIQRKFPPGSLPGVPANAKQSIIYNIDPEHPTEAATMRTTTDPIIQPTQNADDNFVPGIPIGQPAAGKSRLPTNDAARPTDIKGRKPSLFPQKK